MSKVVDLSARRAARAMSFRQSIRVGPHPTLREVEVVVCERAGQRWFHVRGLGNASLAHEELVALYHAVGEALGIAKKRDASQRTGKPCPHCGLKFKGQGLANHVRSHGKGPDGPA